MAARLSPISRLLAIGRRSDAQFDRRILFLSALSLAAAIVEVGALASLVPLLFVLSGREVGLPFSFDVREMDPLGVVMTFALDAGTEAALLDTLRQSRPDITALMISHRETALARCDRVLKVEGGRLAPA